MKAVTRFIFLAAVVTAAFFNSNSAHGQESCFDVFKLGGFNYTKTGETAKFVKKVRYILQVKGTNEFLSGVYRGESPDGAQLRFRVGSSERSFAPTDLVAVRGYRASGKVEDLKVELFMKLLFGRRVARLITWPFRNLKSESDRIEVLGAPRTSADLGATISKSLAPFDRKLETLGFSIPAKTRIYVNERPLVPDLTGPFFNETPVVNIWRGFKGVPTILMSPFFFWQHSMVKDESVLLHERVHSLLFTNFSMKSFVNQSASLQEAFADFVTAHFRNDPTLGKDLFGEGVPVRDIDARTLFTLGDPRKSVSPLFSNLSADIYEKSLRYSHLLWRLRTRVGAEAIDHLLHPLVENLNAYHASYLAQLAVAPARNQSPSVEHARDLEFFLAVLKKTSLEVDGGRWSAITAEEVERESADLKFPGARIDSLAKSLKAAEPATYLVTPASTLRMKILEVYSMGAAGLAIDAGVIFSAGHFLLGAL